MKPLVLLVGPSGSGKNYLCKTLGLRTLPSYTTRPMRVGEQQNVEHIFADKPTYYMHKVKHQIIAETEYDDHMYWATWTQFENTEYDVYIVDPNGVKVIEMAHDPVINSIIRLERPYRIVYLNVNVWKRIKNMRKRGDSLCNIIKRICIDHYTFQQFKQRTDVQIINL